jgi:polyisoprenoid-binding protein YceI
MKRHLCLAAALAIAIPVAHRAQESPHRPLHYRLEVAGSTLRWELPSTFGTVTGTAAVFHGTVDATPLASGAWNVRGRIVVPAAGMRTENRRRDRRMRAILETAKFPDIVFELRRFTGDLSRFHPGENFPVQVAGDLTVHGRTAPVQLPVEVYVFDDRVEVAGTFPLYWKEYGLADPSFVARVKEPMQVVFRLRAVPEKAMGTDPARGLHPSQSTPEGPPLSQVPRRGSLNLGDNDRFP